MRVLILGVGDAFTTRSYGASCVIEGPEGYVLLDCPDLIHRVLAESCAKSGWNVSAKNIHDILLTHLHGDHCNGLESFGFKRFVDRISGEVKQRPRLHTHPKSAARVWERLAPAMDAPLTKGAEHATLDDFYELRIFDPAHTPCATVAGLTIEARYTIHPVPTVGLKISNGTSTLGWSGDTTYDQEHIEWLSTADLIVHETNLGPAHTHIELLNALPEQIRSKMRVTHLHDEFDPESSLIPMLESGEVLEF